MGYWVYYCCCRHVGVHYMGHCEFSSFAPSLALNMSHRRSRKMAEKRTISNIFSASPNSSLPPFSLPTRSCSVCPLPWTWMPSDVISAWAAGNSLVFGEYILIAANVEAKRWTLRLVGFACITFAFLLHGSALKWGLRLQNFLGVFKILVLVFVIITGFVALGGHMKIDKPDNFSNAFEGTTANASNFCLSLYNVRPSFYPLNLY